MTLSCTGGLHHLCSGILTQKVPTIPRPQCTYRCHHAQAQKVAA